MKLRSPLLGLVWLAMVALAEAGEPFAIEVIDSKTGRGVPLVELRTVNEIRLVTDSRGIAAFDEPGLMGRQVYFHASSQGYEVPKDGFGFRGKAFDIKPGGRGRLAIERVNIAERLYRVTGAGIDRDSVLVGDPTPIRQPLLNAGVLGSDSVQSILFQGKMHWFWGDTNRSGYPLGNFHSPTATSILPNDGGLDIEMGINLDYAVDTDGFAAASARMPGDGPTWIEGLVVLKDGSGSERMFSAYAKIRPPMETYERGLMEFDPTTRQFAKVAPIPLDAPVYPYGHAFLRQVDGVEYVYFADPFPLVRVRANADDLAHPERFEAFTCLLPGSTLKQPKIDRSEEGTPRYTWRQGAPAVDAVGQERLIKAGVIERASGLLQLQDVETGRRVVAHRGSTYWNEFHKRWVLIAVEIGGESSHLGEVWFAQADTPLGPWAYARKVASHDKYSFYNPKQHPEFAKEGGRTIYFEGTYSVTFSGNTNPTPRYDYNQIMYKLDLGDPRLNLPEPVFEVDGRLAFWSPGHEIRFFALEHPTAGTIPIGAPPIGHGLSLDFKNPPVTTTLLFERTGRDGTSRYSTNPDGGKPIGRVWKSPVKVAIPKD